MQQKPQIKYRKSEALKILEQLAFDKLKDKYPSFPYPPKVKYNDNTANSLTKAVIDFIVIKGFQAERVSNTGRQVKQGLSTKWIKGSGMNGTTDIHATINGKSVKIEIKCAATGDKKQSPGQQEYQKAVEAAGGVYLIVRDFAGFYEWFNSNPL